MNYLSRITTVWGMCLVTSTVFAEETKPATLDALLQKVEAEHLSEQKVNAEREAAFLADKDQQQNLLDLALAELKQQEALSDQLKTSYDKQEKQLSALEEKLTLTMGTLGEMFGVVKQVSGDLRGQFENSIISSEFSDRMAFVSNLAEQKKLATAKDLRRLWFEMQREMTESGKVKRYPLTITDAKGSRTQSDVVRVGSFNLVGEGKYLQWLGDSKQAMVLGRQPSGRFLSTAKSLLASHSGTVDFAIDPSRGSILSLLVQAPELSERIQQGGLVGYVILALLLGGLILVIERFVNLSRMDKKIKVQMKDQKAHDDNPLGQLMKVYQAHSQTDLENMELKLHETILKALPGIERGVATIKMLAAIAPLLGLLGTVTGMIATFQSITLFGTGDPKLMAGGISQALVTTVLGLVAAIPLLLMHNAVSNKSKALVQVLEEQSAGLIAEHGQGQGA